MQNNEHAGLTPEGNKLLNHFEAPAFFLYDDQAGVYPPKPWQSGTSVKGYLTIGFGHLCSRDEIKKYTGKTITLSEAEELRQRDLSGPAVEVDRRFKGLKPHERDALIIFAFNCPAGLDGSPGKYLRKGDIPACLAAWMEYANVTDPHTHEHKELQGLVRRRTSEILLFMTGRAVWFVEAK